MSNRTSILALLVIAAATLTGTASTSLPACTTEASTTDCRWDASHQGNGQGQDFTVQGGQVTH